MCVFLPIGISGFPWFAASAGEADVPLFVSDLFSCGVSFNFTLLERFVAFLCGMLAKRAQDGD